MTKKMAVVDNFELSNKKLALEKTIIRLLLEAFEGHRIATPTHPYRSYYTCYVEKEGPSHKFLDNNLRETHFGLLGPKPADTRKRFAGIPIGFLPPADLVGVVKFTYNDEFQSIDRMIFNIFGEVHKEAAGLFLEKLEGYNLDTRILNAEVELKTTEPRKEGENYLNTHE